MNQGMSTPQRGLHYTQMIIRFLFILIVTSRIFCCLKIIVNENIILNTPIQTSDIGGILRYLLEEGDYSSLVWVLSLKRMNIRKIYYNAISSDQDPFLIYALNLFKEGFLPKSEASLILPAKLLHDHANMPELLESDIKDIPENPLTDGFLIASCLQERTLIAAINRGLTEKDQGIYWTTWLLEIPFDYNNVWYFPDLWRILLIQTFCDARNDLKRKFFNVINMAVDQVYFPVTESSNQLLLMNISLFCFYLEFLREIKVLKDSRRPKGLYFSEMDGLNKDAQFVFNKISINRARKGHAIFAAFDLNSANLLNNLSMEMANNPFYYESRIEMFANVLERIESVSDVFADWFSNLYSCFFDVLPFMSLKLLLKSWTLYLSFKPTFESICSLISWFRDKIKEDFRFELAKQLSPDLLLEFYRSCKLPFIPRPLELFPYEMRRDEHLRNSRGGTVEIFSYGFKRFWFPDQKPILKVLALFEFMKSKRVDLFESVDIYFQLNNANPKEIGLGKFLEIVLEEFLMIKEWYIPMSLDGKEIIPSPLFPPSFTPFLAQLIVRCRHVSCKAPFKISEKYLKIALVGKDNFSRLYLEKLVKTQLNFLIQSDGKHLPKLTQMYHLYFSHLKVLQEGGNSEALYRGHFKLYSTISQLWTNAENPANWDLSPNHLEIMENKLYEIISLSFEMFSLELYKTLGPNTFSEHELSKFLYSNVNL